MDAGADTVMAALADPTRWRVLSLLAERGEATATTLAGELPGDLGELTAFDLGPDAVPAIAARLNRWLALPAGEREAAEAALVATVRAATAGS